MRPHGKRDANHARLKARYQAHGATVLDLADVGGGCPDLLVGIRGVDALVELKAAKGTLTPDQELFHGSWRGSPVVVVRTESAVDSHVAELRRLAYVVHNPQDASTRPARSNRTPASRAATTR